MCIYGMTFVRLYIIIYIYIYTRYTHQRICLAQNVLENATALGSRIPPHAVLLQVNDNTPVMHLRNDVRTIIYIYIDSAGN